MVATGSFGMPDDDPRPPPPPGRFADDLAGLDPNDPEARAFAEHLDRVERVRPGFTVEGYIGGVGDFADAANRLGGHRRLTAGILVALILLGVVIAVWDTLVFIFTTLFA
ncbi:hypothetical protein [Actinokineospora sp. HUAS TT18]|uniref:hypothetical protein n=1 Tax=Actinokineospora sp. HUAS TT18 TaxID=3447451 RepID=UPI003F528C8C